MVQYKLIYFNVRGRGEPARLIFAQAGVPYEDVRLEGSEWATLKPKTPFGQLPLLEVDGETIAQSKAIARYLGKEFNMAPSSDFMAARLDMLVDGVDDTFSRMRPFYVEKDPEKKQEIWSQLVTDTLEPFLSRYEKFLLDNGTTYFVSNNLTWGDLVIFDRMDGLRKRSPDLFDNHNALSEFIIRIAELPAIKNWIQQRPDTEI